MFKLVRPIIIVGKPSEAGLYTAYDYRSVLVSSPDQITIYHRGIIRTQSHNSSWRICVPAPVFFIYSVVIDHGVHISSTDQKSKSRFAKHIYTVVPLPVRLRYHADLISMSLQDSAYDGRTK